LSELLAEYLTIVRPVEVHLSKKFNCKGADDLNEFLWADYRKGVWDGDVISDQLKIETASHGMHSLGLREYRQVATVFMEKHLKYKASVENVNAVLDLQAGHSSRTAETYAVATEDHADITREAMHQYCLESDEWSELLLSQRDSKQTIKTTDSEPEKKSVIEDNRQL
jgi:hypothetical protein